MQSEPYPSHLLPATMRKYTSEVSYAIGCDPAYVALQLYPALASVIGGTRTIRVSPTWSEPLMFWIATIGSSTSKKSIAIEYARYWVSQKYSEEYAVYEAKSKKRKSDEPGRIISNITLESVIETLYYRSKGCFYATDELSTLFGGFNAFKGKDRGSDEEQFNEIYSCQPINVKRRGSKPLHVDRPIMSIAGSITPDLFAKHVLKKERVGSGMSARFILAMPTEHYLAVPEEPSIEYNSLSSVFDLLDQLGFEANGKPIEIPLTLDARSRFIEWNNSIRRERMPYLSDAYNASTGRLISTCARLALLFALVTNAEMGNAETPSTIGIDILERAIALSEWHIAETHRIYGEYGMVKTRRGLTNIDETASTGSKILAFLAKKNLRSISAREVQKARLCKTSDEAKQILDALVDQEKLEVSINYNKNHQPVVRYEIPKK